MKRRLLFLTFVMCLTAPMAMAQTSITGRVTSANGDALPGVSVLVKGTTNGTSTDSDGTFSLNAPSDGVLVVSFIGFTSQEVAIGNRTTIDVALEKM